MEKATVIKTKMTHCFATEQPARPLSGRGITGEDNAIPLTLVFPVRWSVLRAGIEASPDLGLPERQAPR